VKSERNDPQQCVVGRLGHRHLLKKLRGLCARAA
jgi:hypothetical protein